MKHWTALRFSVFFVTFVVQLPFSPYTHRIMIRLAFSTNAFKKNSLEEAIDSIRAIGYGGVELMADMHHALPGRMTPALRRETLKRITVQGGR